MKKKQLLTIAHLTRYYYPHIGGVEHHIEMVGQVQRKREYQVFVITEQYQHALSANELQKEISIIRLKSVATADAHSLMARTKHKLSIWKGIASQLTLLSQADVIQVHDVFWWLLPFLPLLKIWRKRIYMTFHGHEGNPFPTKKQCRWHQLAAKLTHGNLCIGGFHEKWYQVKPSEVLYGATVAISNRSHHRRKKFIIFAGRLAADTGIMEYLKALHLLSVQYQQHFHLDVYGDGPQMGIAQAYAKKHNLSVVFKGFVKHEEIIFSRYAMAFVSRYLAILEAMSAGVPVIATYNSDIKYDYLAKTPFGSWINIVGSAQQVAETVANRPTLSSGAVDWVNQQTWSHVADVYEKIYENFADSHCTE